MDTPKVASIWRYPVKSMMGEELNACHITSFGLFGDRAYAVFDTSAQKLANAKNPLKWPDMFSYRATYAEPPAIGHPLPRVRITLPDGTMMVSDEPDIHDVLSVYLKRPVRLIARTLEDMQFEGYVPDLEELPERNTVFTRTSPKGTFFDIGIVHLLTTSALRRLRQIAPGSQPEVRRFRPNLVIDVPDDEGFIENEWVGRTLRIGKQVRLYVKQPTKRCIMTTLAQGDLPNDPGVLHTAVRHNEGSVGVYASVIRSGPIVRGDFIRFE